MVTKEQLEKARQGFLNRKGSAKRDPTQWAPKIKALLPKDGSPITYRFRILPPILKGSSVLDGDRVIVSPQDVDWCIEHGSHWFNNRPYECPRIAKDGQCPVCDIGFGLFKTETDKERRSAIAKAYLPKSYWLANVYLLNMEANPEEVRGKVFWTDLNKSIFDICEETTMRDDQGSVEDPKPFGLFYDEDEGYVFQLEARLKGGYANYGGSKFLVVTRGSLALTAAKKADMARIKQILEQRQYLPSKVAKVQIEELEKIAAGLADEPAEVVGDGSVEEPAAPIVEAGTAARPRPLHSVRPAPAPAAPVEELPFEPDPVTTEAAVEEAPMEAPMEAPVETPPAKPAPAKAKPAAAATRPTPAKTAPAKAPAKPVAPPTAAAPASEEDKEFGDLMKELETPA